ncbi:Uncharacterised protein [Bordetella ansorpii]|uniref:Uncharacterized protein n=1 Tax=Bordetella ansorpii TaxID=288768 RepID=A0A157RA64_9BORD|nr:hypothetical protein [Bordetella ansorpii]SAI54786.1 Uncharacterised protein [Bordetella ansorpii]
MTVPEATVSQPGLPEGLVTQQRKACSCKVVQDVFGFICLNLLASCMMWIPGKMDCVGVDRYTGTMRITSNNKNGIV